MYFTGTLCRKVVLNRVFIMWLNSLTFPGLSRNTSQKALEFSRDLTGIWHRNRANFPAIYLPNIFQKPLEFFRGLSTHLPKNDLNFFRKSLPKYFLKIIRTFPGNFSGIWHRNRANFPAISLPNIFQKPLEFSREVPRPPPKTIYTFFIDQQYIANVYSVFRCLYLFLKISFFLFIAFKIL